MAINRYTYPYEILFRLSQSGNVQGCHRKDLEIVKDDDTGEVFSIRETDPMPIAGGDMEEVIGAVNVALTASLAAAQSQSDSLASQLQSCQASLQQSERERGDIAAQLAEANETIERLTAQVQHFLEQQADTEANSELFNGQVLATNE